MTWTPPENPIAEGIISFLASRPHAWSSWRLTALRYFDRDGKWESARWLLELTDAEMKKRQHCSDQLELSPSLFLQETLRSDESVPPTWTNPPKPWKKKMDGRSLDSEGLAGWAVREIRAFQHSQESEIFIKIE
jgi:hypothetical protein